MNKEVQRRLGDLSALVGSLVFVVLIWYAYVSERTSNLALVILITLFFGACALINGVAITAKKYEEFWFGYGRIPKDLNWSQNLLLTIGKILFMVAWIWMALGNTIKIHVIVRVLLLILLMGFIIQDFRKRKE